jgi:enterochelin esterase-like enzyme
MHPMTMLVENTTIDSKFLERKVIIDVYLPKQFSSGNKLSLLLINDGQDMVKLGLESILENLEGSGAIRPLACVGIHAGDRKVEFGVASEADYLGRGARATKYTAFIREELIPFIKQQYPAIITKPTALAGFSMGGLMALDMGWNFPAEFSVVGIFSGSLWWRALDQEDPAYNDEKHRIMQEQLRKGHYHEGQRFFFSTGSLDETRDRNNNGIIDAIDDTMAMISELEKHGYSFPNDLHYINFEDGKHDVQTWARAMPVFLQWAFGMDR